MTDILSQDEIDQLLSAISSGDAQQEDFSATQAEQMLDELFDDGEEVTLTAPKSASEAKADTALEKSQQALKMAEQLAANLSAGESEIQNRARFVTADELAALQATVDAQGERIRELTAQGVPSEPS